jgi:hypothetical protein
LYELFLELERGLDLMDALERYACISHYSAFIAANGGARLPPLIAVNGAMTLLGGGAT